MSMIGMVLAFAGSQDKIPAGDGWLLCDGRALARAGEYAQLFETIGTLHGNGDGVNTFNLPDFRGYFLRGATGGSNVDPSASKRIAFPGGTPSEAGSLQYAATGRPHNPFRTTTVPNHCHDDPTWDGQPGQYELATEYRGPGGFDYGPQAAPTGAAGEHYHDINGGDEETRPINKYVHWIIKAK